MTDEDEKQSETELAYIAGHHMAWRLMLTLCLKNLGEELTDAETRVVRLVAHLHDTRAALRRVCEDHGDNDWPDDLHLADVVEKHLARHLDERRGGEGG